MKPVFIFIFFSPIVQIVGHIHHGKFSMVYLALCTYTYIDTKLTSFSYALFRHQGEKYGQTSPL